MAAVGDSICVFGGSVPFVLRDVCLSRPQKRHFRLLGECYVHGIMNGEALAEMLNTVEFMIS